MNSSDAQASVQAAYADARARGLPDGWTCSIDKRNRRKWTIINAADGGSKRSCDSIPKALAISVELNLLPADTVIEHGANYHRRQQQQQPLSGSSGSGSGGTSMMANKTSAALGGRKRKASSSSSFAVTLPTAANKKRRGRPPNKPSSSSSSFLSAATAVATTAAKTLPSQQSAAFKRGRTSAQVAAAAAAAAAALEAASTTSLKQPAAAAATDSERLGGDRKMAAAATAAPNTTSDNDSIEEETETEEEDDEEDDEDEEDDLTPPEPMHPETSLDGLERVAPPTTVHWDPNSPDGKLIGRTVRIGILRRNLQKCNLLRHSDDSDDGDDHDDDDDDDDDDPYHNQFWMEGRIVLYDPYTHKHKIEWNIPAVESTASTSTTTHPAAAVHAAKRGRPPKKKPPSTPTSGGHSAITSYNKTKNSTTWIWLRNEQHNLHVAMRLVWAYVRGFAWWPAVVMECNTPLESSSSSSSANNNNNTAAAAGAAAAASAKAAAAASTSATTTTSSTKEKSKRGRPPKNKGKVNNNNKPAAVSSSTTVSSSSATSTSRTVAWAGTHHAGNISNSSGNNTAYVHVEFFGSGEISFLRDSPDCLREFDPSKPLDPVVARHKKKRNAMAIGLATQEWNRIRTTRRDAALWYARKAFHMTQLRMTTRLFNNSSSNFNASPNISGSSAMVTMGAASAAASASASASASMKDSEHQLIGKRIQFFRDDVNYPYGDTVTAKVHAYSAFQRKWLVSYELSSKTRTKYDASWVNLLGKKHSSYKVLLDKKKTTTTTDNKTEEEAEDLVPFLVGFDFDPVEHAAQKLSDKKNAGEDINKYVEDDEEEKDDVPEEHARMIEILAAPRCRRCVGYWKQDDNARLTCRMCQSTFHLGCCDPPVSMEAYHRMLSKDGKQSVTSFVCDKCTPCRACYQMDICFGSHPNSTPPTLSFPKGESLDLCSMCRDSYDHERFCPNCAHTWDDVKYQKVQRQLDWIDRNPLANTPGPRKRGRPPQLPVLPLVEDTTTTMTLGKFSFDAVLPLGARVDRTWYYSITPEWGYTEVEMLVCDSCKIWVHAGCAGITEEEYNLTSDGGHPIYSKEFLCRVCCRKRCKDLIQALNQQDRMGLFAVPVALKDAPNYRDVIQHPMDLQSCMERAESEEYLSYSWIREMFELIVLNALTFNNYYAVVWNEAKRFYHDCLANVFAKMGKAAPPSKYEAEILANFKRAEEAKKKEEDRVQVDDSVEKKDLVAGSMAAAPITLPELRGTQPDQGSCLPHTEVRMKSLDAFYSSWMDCCFSCGCTGAADTMLFCVDCGEAYHSFCANAPVHSMTASAVAGWRCPNCKVCEISGDVPEEETHMLFCEMCDRAFSLSLLDPPLKEAPSGLWVCGQCVDCACCGNTGGDPRGASLKHWSRDPKKCYSCGGCEGLVDGRSSCCVCEKLLRDDEPDLVECGICGNKVHCRCDTRAEDYSISHEYASRTQKMKSGNTYQCPSCYKAPDPVDLTESEVDRKHLYNVAWHTILSSQPDLTDEAAKQELQVKLVERIEWSVRDLWRNEYLSIIQDAVKFYETARTTFGEPRIVVQHVFNKVVDLPLWKAQRALRFVTMARRANWESGINIESIDKLVTCAKVAAAFLDVSCRVMGFDLARNVVHPERVQLLLEPPGECGTVKLPTDKISQSNDPSFMEAAIGEAAAARLASKSRKETRSPPTIQLANPLIGWGDQLGAGMEGEWKDPRECCLCHLCGDDDAGFLERVESVDTTDERGHFGLGRLLPMPDGYWVHTSCALWSSEVYEAPDDGLIHAVEKARARGGQLKCFGCGRAGATVGCNKSNCSFNFHFPCAKASGCVFTSNQHVYCSSHKGGVTGILDKETFELMKALIVEPEKKPAVNEKDTSDQAEADWMPIRVGTIVVHALGKIQQNSDGFHSENYIFPPGYFATRIFWSTVHPRTRTVYALQVGEGENGRIEFSITPADNPSGRISGQSVATVYATLTDRVRKANAKHFTVSDLFSNLPMSRRSRRKTFGLNGPQFFGFGLSYIRKQIEMCPGIEAVVAPLTPSSPKYRFCYKQPSVESILELQRRRAAAKAELALENSSGCARTEGIKAVARSGGSGRITRALVRRAEEDVAEASSSSAGVLTKKGDKTDRSVNQVKYRKMKSVPLEQRLVAKRSHIHGWGLFTKIDIAKNDPIVEYMGEVIRQPVADKREKQYDVSGEGSCYMFRLDLDRIVDATMIGCMARFMNHACTPNAYAKIISVDTPDMGTERKIVVFANRDIAASEEITYDYKFPVEDGSLRCTCGSPNCIGRLN